jgi:uncharacterized protein YbaR (Trm112 family)
MYTNLLDILRCPFCGTTVSIVENEALVRAGARIDAGVLGCECCAFPVVAGIPVMMADRTTRHALRALEAGRGDEALVGLLGLSDDANRRERFRQLSERDTATYRDTLELLCLDAEGAYFLHRFTDPTFLTSETLLRAISQQHWPVERRMLDLCGGSGHLTRVLAGLHSRSEASNPDTVLADVHFWKLWLATRFTAPGSEPVCCDANHPLPFASDTFSTVVLADAFPYIWHKRLLAGEMMRLVGGDGVVAMPHLHSALGDNVSAGDTLTPAAYQALFESHRARLFSDARLFDDAVERRVVDLTRDVSPDQLGTEPSLTLIATARATLFRRYEVTDPGDVRGVLVVNPLYRISRRGTSSVLTLTFPTPEYEAEFGDCRRYLPDHLTVEGDLTGPIAPETLGARYAELRRRRVIIDTPVGYCRPPDC